MIRKKFKFDTDTTSITPKITRSPLKRRHSSESTSDQLAAKRKMDTGIHSVEDNALTVIPNRSTSFERLHGCEKIASEKLQKLQQIKGHDLLEARDLNCEASYKKLHHTLMKEKLHNLYGFETSLNLLENSNISSKLSEIEYKNTKWTRNISGDDSRTVPSLATETILNDQETKKAERINTILDVKKSLETISTNIHSPEFSSHQLIHLLKAQKRILENVCSEMKADYKDTLDRQLIEKIDISKGPCDSLDQFLCLEENLNDVAKMSELVDILISEIPTNVMTIDQALKIVIKRIMIQEVADSIRELNNETFVSELKNIRQAVLGAMKIRFLQTNSSAVIKLWNENLLSN